MQLTPNSVRQIVTQRLLLLGASTPHRPMVVIDEYGIGSSGLSEPIWVDVRDRGVKMSMVSPGIGERRFRPAVSRCQRQSRHATVSGGCGSAIQFVIDLPERCCTTEITLHPKQSPE